MPSPHEESASRFLQSVPLRDSELWCRPMNYLYSHKWANIKLVQKALHVREGTITKWARCNRTIEATYTYNVNSTVNYHKKFTNRNDCRALILSGDHDMAAPNTATQEWIRSLKLDIQSDWRPWFVEGQIAGYTTAYVNGDYEMTYATVKLKSIADMAEKKKDSQKNRRILRRARGFYTDTLCGCGGGADRRSVINCTVPQSSRQFPTKYSSEEIDNEDLQGLMRLLTMRKGGGATVDVDSEGNLVWRKQVAETTYGGGVGRIGRIDEDKPCCFSEVDVRYSRRVSDAISRRKNLAYY